MRKLVIAAITAMLFATPFYGRPLAYEDEYVKFEYDDEVLQAFKAGHNYDGGIGYECRTYMTQTERDPVGAVAIITLIDDRFIEVPENFTDIFPEYIYLFKSPEIIAGNEELEFQCEDGSHGYAKIVSNYGDQYILAACSAVDTSSAEFAYCKSIYDSVEASEMFEGSGFGDKTVNDKTAFDISNDICYNVVFSKQVKDYVDEGIRVCQKFLDGDLYDSEAARKIEALVEAVEEQFSDSEYIHDGDLKFLFPNSLYFSFVDPEVHIIRAKQNLEAVLETIGE